MLLDGQINPLPTEYRLLGGHTRPIPGRPIWNLVSGKGGIGPALPLAHQSLIDSLAAAADIQRLRVGALVPVAVGDVTGDEGHIAHLQSSLRVVSDLDHQGSLEDLERRCARRVPRRSLRRGLLSADDQGGHGEVGVLRLRVGDERLDDLVRAVLRVQVLGSVVVGDEVGLAGLTEGVRLGMPALGGGS